MSESNPVNVLRFPTARKRAYPRHIGPVPPTVVQLSKIRREREFEVAPNRLHDFEVDMFTVLIGVLSPEQRGNVLSCLDVFAQWPKNRAYAEAAATLRDRLV
jgi:hypothetical protein